MAQAEAAKSSTGAEETLVWRGNPSHVVFLKTYVLCFLFCWLIVPLFVAAWRYLIIRTTVYEITTERLRVRRGVLSRTTEDMELYRIKDYSVEQPILYRLFKVGNVLLVTSDKSHPLVTIIAVSEPTVLIDRLRSRVEVLRRELGIRELDR